MIMDTGQVCWKEIAEMPEQEQQPAQTLHKEVFAGNYLDDALHEAAHWCRRNQDKYTFDNVVVSREWWVEVYYKKDK